MDGVVEKVLIRLAGPNMNLPLQMGVVDAPALLHNQTQIVLFPVLQHAPVDLAGPAVEQRHGKPIPPARAEGRVPGAPVLSRQRPAIPTSQNDFALALVAERVTDIAVFLAHARPLETVFVDIGIVVLVKVDYFKLAEIDRVGTARPGAVEELRIKELKSQRDPATRGGTVA